MSCQSPSSPYSRILTVFGTRPEAIKMAPLVHILGSHSKLTHRVCVTGQHREMLDDVVELFGINPDYDLNVMEPNQDLTDITSKVLLGMREVIEDYKPDLVLVHGDTATTFGAALSAYYKQIPVGHVEAGLRTGNIYSPWPEEANRKLTTSITRTHYAPTVSARDNLISEGVNPEDVVVTGNTVIDALFLALEKLKQSPELTSRLEQEYSFLHRGKKLILVTGHRRESFGEGFERICNALLTIAKQQPDCQILYPVHLNPEVHEPVNRLLEGAESIYTIEPTGYLDFVYLMNRSYLVLTDSGGIQEEAPSLGKPVLVMRETTERSEAVLAGTVKLVGTNADVIVREVTSLLTDDLVYQRMSESHNPYGDGDACQIIVTRMLHECKNGELQSSKPPNCP